jgi:tyrosinase
MVSECQRLLYALLLTFPRQNLTNSERSDYLNATLCLMKAPPKSSIPGAKSRWDELHYVHIVQSDYIHFSVGWDDASHSKLAYQAVDQLTSRRAGFCHGIDTTSRYTKLCCERSAAIKAQCRKDATKARTTEVANSNRYWNEALDAENLKDSPIFDPDTGFGGDGVSPYGCVTDGPFANATLHLTQFLTTSEYCIIRKLNGCLFQGAAQSFLDTCLASKTFEEVWHCIEARPHAAGHVGVGGVVSLIRAYRASSGFY